MRTNLFFLRLITLNISKQLRFLVFKSALFNTQSFLVSTANAFFGLQLTADQGNSLNDLILFFGQVFYFRLNLLIGLYLGFVIAFTAVKVIAMGIDFFFQCCATAS